MDSDSRGYMLGECQYGERTPLIISQDVYRGTVTIDGTTYSREILADGFGASAKGKWFRILERRRGGEVIVEQRVVPNWVARLARFASLFRC